MRAKEFVEEARSHPDLNRKFDSGRHELYRWVADHNIGPRAMWGLSMTMLPKLGINPQKGASDDTPKGIYFYPLWYIWPWVNGGEELPWGNDFPYIQLFQYDNSRQMTQQSKVDPAQLKQALRQYCPEEIIENTEYNNDPYWFIYDCLVQLGQSDETTIVRWNKVLRDLGFTSVMDDGKGWIATNEPVQGIILDPRIIKQVKTFENYNRKQPINESIDADKVLQYVKRAHAPDEFNIEYSITDHPKWELKSIPLSKLKLDPEGEQRDPYRRVNWVDYDKVQDLIPKIISVLKSSPIVVDPQGWIIDGNHRATAAAEAGLKSVPAFVPAAKSINEIAMSGSQLPGQWVQDNNYEKIYDFHTDKNHYRARFRIDDTYDDEDDSVNGKTMFAYFLAQLPNGQWTDNITNINEPDTIKIYSTMAGLIQQILKSQPDISSVSMFGRDRVNNIYQKLLQRNITKLLPGWQVTSQGIERLEPAVAENFADGKVKGKSRPGRVKRAGASCAGSVTDLRAKARKYGGEKGKMYHWCANMKGGKKK